MGKTTAASSSKASKPVSAKCTVTKATKATAKKKTPLKSNGIGIKNNKKGASAKTQTWKKVAVSKKKKVQPPMPIGWPVSSKLTYPAPRAEITVKNNDSSTITDDIMSLDSDNDGSSTRHAPSSSNNMPSIPANYLTPGNLLQQSCNGSDVFLRKRAVQSTSMSFPSSGGTANNKGGPTRFLIVFPGRMSLKAPPKPTASTNAGNDDNEDDNTHDGKEDEEKDDTNNDTKTKKKSPFAPTHPPQLLGKLVSLGGNERKMELRIPMPSSSESTSDVSKTNQLVMSGKAIPLSGKYMALSFKRTGGAKDSSSGGGTGKNKKKGTGSITCKDVFRSVIVLGDSKIVDDEGKQVLPQKSAAKKNEHPEKKVAMKHYGGSERALDGGGKYNGGVTAGKKSLKATTVAAASRKRKDSISSKELGLSSSSDESDEDIDTGSVSSDEFVPAAAKKKRKSAAGGAKRKATNESDDDDEQDVVPVKKRTPRRSTGSVKVSYVDENSDIDMGDDDSDDNEEEDESSDEEEDFKPNAKPKSIAKKKPTKKTAEKAPVAGKRGSTSRAKKGGSGPVYNLESDEEDESSESSSKSSEEDEEYEEPKAKPKNAKKPPPKKAAAKTKRDTGSNKEVSSSSSTKNVANDIIEIDSGDDKKPAPSTPTKKKVVDEKDLQAIAADAKKRLLSLSTPEKSPPKSPIARGRRKKSSPKKKSPLVRKENELNLDDDPFTFLSQTD